MTCSFVTVPRISRKCQLDRESNVGAGLSRDGFMATGYDIAG